MLDETAAGFSLRCLAYVLLCLWEERGLNEGADLCQRLFVNGLGQRWTHTHTLTALSVFFCCKTFTLRIPMRMCHRFCVSVSETSVPSQGQHVYCAGIKLNVGLKSGSITLSFPISPASHLNSG